MPGSPICVLQRSTDGQSTSWGRKIQMLFSLPYYGVRTSLLGIVYPTLSGEVHLGMEQ